MKRLQITKNGNFQNTQLYRYNIQQQKKLFIARNCQQYHIKKESQERNQKKSQNSTQNKKDKRNTYLEN
jgi:hypothetical protein